MKHSKKNFRRLLSLLTVLSLLLGLSGGGLSVSARETPTSLGLAQHGINAHRDGWIYQYGAKGQSVTVGGKVVRASDCAGLICAYFSDVGVSGCQGGATSQVRENCAYSGYISNGLPRIHGLTLTMPDGGSESVKAHVGIYIGGNEVTDNSEPGVNMLRGPVLGSGRNWTMWHVFDLGTQYPVNGWYQLDGKMVHYSNYEYDVSCTVDGLTIGEDGYAYNADGTAAPVNPSLLSSQYASASQVASYLKTAYGEQISPEAPSPDDYNGRLTGNGVRLRNEPNTSSIIVTTMYRGLMLVILEETTGQSITDGGVTSTTWYKVVTADGKTGYVSSLFVERLAPAKPKTPTISASGGYVTLSCATEGADIYYTTDCSTPTESSTPYTGPVYMTGCTYKAIAVKGGSVSSVMSASVLSNDAIFTDVYSDIWYFNVVNRAVCAGLFHGYGDNSFGPGNQITRAQFVTALASLDGVDTKQYMNATSTGYSDVPLNTSDGMCRAIIWARERGFIAGFGDGTFHPSESITREQMCAILARYAGLTAEANPELFTDDSSISDWARNGVYACRATGLVHGLGDNSFDPQGTSQRAHACVVILALYQLRQDG